MNKLDDLEETEGLLERPSLHKRIEAGTFPVMGWAGEGADGSGEPRLQSEPAFASNTKRERGKKTSVCRDTNEEARIAFFIPAAAGGRGLPPPSPRPPCLHPQNPRAGHLLW